MLALFAQLFGASQYDKQLARCLVGNEFQGKSFVYKEKRYNWDKFVEERVENWRGSNRNILNSERRDVSKRLEQGRDVDKIELEAIDRLLEQKK